MNEHLRLRRSLHDELVVLVRDMIIAGELTPGERVSEPALCERFGVSRTPLREALKVLAAEGLVQLLPRRGARVAQITAEEVEELFPIMGVLEGLAAERAAERATAAELARLKALHDEMRARYRAGDQGGYAKLNRAIHEAIFAIAGSGELTSQYQQMMVRIHASRFVARSSPEDWRTAVEDHERLMTALAARDGVAAFGIMRAHLAHKAEVVNRTLRT
jgi:DNA-binding GntR family transcriptional regulator